MLRLNVNRTFKAPVPVAFLDEAGKEQSGEFSAIFRVMTRDEFEDEANDGKRLLDLVLVDVGDLELFGADGEALTGDDLIGAAKDDPTLSTALVEAYWSNVVKKPRTPT